MVKIKKHISIPSDIDIMILDYARKCNISFSEAVVQLVSSGINNLEMAKAFEKNNALLDKLYSKSYYSTALLEQIYSDFEWDKVTNPNESKALNKFKSKFSKYKYDD
ncbi:MAG: hypothetical protein ACI312_01225 [Bacilli bacterium]